MAAAQCKLKWDKIADLEEMVAFKAGFLAEPGCDVNFDEILEELGDRFVGDPEDEAAILGAWFDFVVGKFRGRDEIALLRHMTVADFDAYVAGLEAGTETTGAHWSLSDETWSPSPEQSDIDVMLRGTVMADCIDWFTTFQAFFAFPWEEEVSFDGDIALVSVENLDTGVVHEPSAPSYPTFR